MKGFVSYRCECPLVGEWYTSVHTIKLIEVVIAMKHGSLPDRELLFGIELSLVLCVYLMSLAKQIC